MCLNTKQEVPYEGCLDANNDAENVAKIVPSSKSEAFLARLCWLVVLIVVFGKPTQEGEM